MPIPFLNSIKLNKNQVEDFCVFNYSGDPTLSSGADFGYLWLNTSATPKVLKFWDGTNYRTLIDSTTISSSTAGLATDLDGGGAGQIVYQDGANDTKFLAAGTAGQVLSSNGASAPSWLNQSSLSAGTAANISGGLAGQLLYQSALATTAKLTIGTAGQALVVNVGATAPEWVDQSTFSVGSATNKPGGNVGDILVQSGSGTTGFLNVGTTGQVITSNGASPQYVNQSTLSVGSATTSGTATNIAGGAANRIPYQTAAGTTAFITDASNAILTTNASSVPALTAATNVTVGKAVDIALGAAGDLLYQSASNDTSFLNIGANGSILTSTGTAPQWSASIPSGSVSGLAASATTDTTNAGNISSGTLGLARLALATGQFYVGDASNNPAATAKSSIPLSGFGAAGADVAMGGYKLTGLGAPTASTDAATMGYVDSVAQGLDVKASCKVGTIANITLSGPGASIDGISLSVDDRVLVKDQTDKKENGIYLWKGAAAAMVRSPDADTVAKLTSAFTFVEQGTNADSGWVCTVNSGTIGSVDIEWLKFSQAGSYTANRGLVLSGSAFNFAQNSDYAIGDLPYATGQTTIGLLPAVATGNALISGGVATAPSWGKIGLTTHVSGTLPVANGGTGATTFTAGQVLYGNGTSALSSSANLFWDNANNRLGIGISTFTGTQPLQVLSAIRVSDANPEASNALNIAVSATTATVETRYGTPLILGTNATERLRIASDGVCTWSNVGGVVSNAMVLNGTGLGVGVSPNTILHVRKDFAGYTTIKAENQHTIAAGTGISFTINDGGTDASWFRRHRDGTGNTDIGYNAALRFRGQVTATERTDMLIDTSGNLGLGVTPSANWNSTATGSKAIEIGFGSVSSDLNFIRTELANNAINGSSGWVYRYALAGATRYSQTLTEHRWFNAGTTVGTAGGAIGFTQAMTLDASGRLLIGGTSTYDFAGQANLVVNGTSNNATLTIASTGVGYLAFADGTTGTSRYVGRIDYDHATDIMALTTNAVERLLIKKNGQVNFQGLASDPAGAAAGDVYYNSGSNVFKVYDTGWKTLPRKYVVQLSDASVTVAGNAYTITHNLGSQDVTVSIRRTTDNAVVQADVVMPAGGNTVTVTFAAAITAAEFYVTVIG